MLFTSWTIYDKLFKPCVTSLVCKIEILISLTSQSCCNIKCESTCKVLTAATAKSPQSCPTLCNPIDGSPPGSPVPGIILQARTRVGCHFLLQCMKVKSESEVAQLCPTLSGPMDCSLPGSSVHGIFQPRVLEWAAIAFSLNTAT